MTEVREISAAETKSLRHRVLWPHIEKEEDCTIDIDLRVDAIHLGVVHDGTIVAIGSFFQMETTKLPPVAKVYRLRAMASDPNYRKMGFGEKLITHALELLKNRDVEVLWCDARKVAIGFYERLGFEKIDEWYEVRNVGLHQFMYKYLKKE